MRNRSLIHLVIFKLSLFLLLFIAIIGYSFYLESKNQTVDLIDQKMSAIVKTQIVNIRKFMWDFDTDNLTKIAKSIADDPHVLGVRIIDKSTDELSDIVTIGGLHSKPKYIIKKNIVYEGGNSKKHNLGVLEIYVDEQRVKQSILSQKILIFIFGFLGYLGLLLIIYITLKRFTKPLVNISSNLETSHIENIDFTDVAKSEAQEITALKSAFGRMQTKIVNYQKELIQSKDRAEQANQAKDDFLANMSHELRTPLNSIVGLSKILIDQETDQESQKLLRTVNNASLSLLRTVNDILDSSKIEANAISIEKTQFGVYNVLNNVVEQIRPLASEKGLKIETDIDGLKQLEFLGDPLRTEHIFRNIISNAVKCTEQGKISIQANCNNTHDAKKTNFSFIVTDTGVGIPEDKIEYIFDKFSQADESTERKFGGTGLGLNITKKLVELMNGSIDVQSQVGQGSVFKVVIPFELSQEKIEKEIKKKTEKPQSQKNNRGNKSHIGEASILIAEDHEFNQIFIKKLVERLNCKEYRLVKNGQEAFDTYKEHKFDIVLMDFHMPELDGCQSTGLIREYEKENKLPNVPIVAMTADAMKEVQEKCISIGMNAYITKPIDEEIFRKTLESWFILNEDGSEGRT